MLKKNGFWNQNLKSLFASALLVQLLTGSTLGVVEAAVEQESLEYKSAVILDVSKSMEVNSPAILNLLSNPRLNDRLAESITLVTYSSGTRLKFFNFLNSSEFAATVSSLKYEKGSTDFNEVVSKLEIWSDEYQEYNRKVYWITDSSGFKKVNGFDETSLRKLAEVADLADWKIIQFNKFEKSEILNKVFEDYIQLKQGDNVIPLDFPAFTSSTQTIRDLSLALSDSKQGARDNQPILFIISMLSFFFCIGLLRFFSNLVWKRKSSLIRQKFVNRLMLEKSKDLANNKDRIWNSIPKFLRKSIDDFADSRNLRSKTRLELLFLTSFCLFVFFFILSNSLLVSFFGTVLLLRFVLARVSKTLYSIDVKKFSKEFPGFLSLLSSGLKSGLSLDQSIDAYCSQSQGVITREFKRVLSEIRMGSSLDEALNELSLRRRDDDLTWLVTAIAIQKEVGGSLSSIIDTVLETINGRSEVRREVKALSAEGKLSAYVLIALPISIFLYLTLTNREFIQVLWQEPLGIGVLVVVTILIAIGWVWMKKIVNVKV